MCCLIDAEHFHPFHMINFPVLQNIVSTVCQSKLHNNMCLCGVTILQSSDPLQTTMAQRWVSGRFHCFLCGLKQVRACCNEIKDGLLRIMTLSLSCANKQCYDYIWVISRFITYQGCSYIRGLTVYFISGSQARWKEKVKQSQFNKSISITQRYPSMSRCINIDNVPDKTHLTGT